MQIIVNASKLPIGFGTSFRFFLWLLAADTNPTVFAPEAPALVAFTSGATGTPKGVIFTNKMLSAQMKIFKYVFGVKAGAKRFTIIANFFIVWNQCWGN